MTGDAEPDGEPVPRGDPENWGDVDIDAAFAAIVAQYSDAGPEVGPWPAAEDLDGPPSVGGGSAQALRADQERPAPGSRTDPGTGPATGGTGTGGTGTGGTGGTGTGGTDTRSGPGTAGPGAPGTPGTPTGRAGTGPNAPGTSAPGTSAPGTSASGTSASGTSASGTSASGTSAPGTSAPGASADDAVGQRGTRQGTGGAGASLSGAGTGPDKAGTGGGPRLRDGDPGDLTGRDGTDRSADSAGAHPHAADGRGGGPRAHSLRRAGWGGARADRASGRHVLDPSDPAEDPQPEDGYVPPEPPPIGRSDFVTTFAWVCVIGGPLFLLLAALAWRSLPGWLLLTALVAFVGGFVLLVARMPGEPPDDPDDGAVV